MTRDARVAAEIATLLAITYMWTGEHDSALQELARVAKMPGGPTAGDLKLNPVWDEIRADPRFPKIVADAAMPLFVKANER